MQRLFFVVLFQLIAAISSFNLFSAERSLQADAAVIPLIKTKEIAIIDDNGVSRAGLGLYKNTQPTFYLANDKGVALLEIIIRNNSPQIIMKDNAMRNRLSIGVDREGDPIIALYSPEGKDMLTLSYLDKRGASLVIQSKTTHAKTINGVVYNTPTMMLIDQNNKIKAAFLSDEKGNSLLSFPDDSGNPDLAIGRNRNRPGVILSSVGADGFFATKDDTGEPVILMRKNGKVAWSVPLLKEKDVPALGPDSDMREMMKGMLK